MFTLGYLAFGLFFLNDLNDHRLHRGFLKPAFPVGAVMLTIATVGLCMGYSAPCYGFWRGVFFLLALAFLGLMVHALFFALPVKEAYAEQDQGRAVSDRGVYALCRHPGVLFFIPAYLCLWLSCGLPLYAVFVYSALTVLLVLYEDKVVFPQVLAGYEEYQKKTPFLLPNSRSIRACMEDYRRN